MGMAERGSQEIDLIIGCCKLHSTSPFLADSQQLGLPCSLSDSYEA